MRARVSRDSILDVIKRAYSVSDRKSSSSLSSILSTILVECKDNNLYISSTDLETAYTGKVFTELEGEGAFCIPAKQFYDIIRNFPHDEFILEGDFSNGVHIKSLDDDIMYRLSCLPPEEFPNLPDTSIVTVLDIQGEVLSDMISKVIYAVSKDDVTISISGILFTKEDNKLRLVATDGHRLSLIDSVVDGIDKLGFSSIIIPRKAAQEIKSIASNDMVVRIGVHDNYFILSFSSGTLFIRPIDGHFPDYKSVIPDNPDKKIFINRLRLIDALKRACIFSVGKYSHVTFNISYNDLVLHTRGSELGESKERLYVDYKGEPFMVTFNARYILDVLKVMRSEEIEFGIGSVRSLCRITGADDPGFLALVAPVVE